MNHHRIVINLFWHWSAFVMCLDMESQSIVIDISDVNHRCYETQCHAINRRSKLCAVSYAPSSEVPHMFRQLLLRHRSGLGASGRIGWCCCARAGLSQSPLWRRQKPSRGRSRPSKQMYRKSRQHMFQRSDAALCSPRSECGFW